MRVANYKYTALSCSGKYAQLYQKAKAKAIYTLEELKWNVFTLFYYEK